MAVGWAACGGDDDETPAPPAGVDASQEATSDDATSPTEPATDSDSDSDSGGLDTPSIDPATMPASGNLQFVVDGSTHDFDISTYDCQVGPDVVFVGATDESDVFISATNSGDGGWAGQLQIGEPDGDRIYGSLAGLEGTSESPVERPTKRTLRVRCRRGRGRWRRSMSACPERG
jgi:hypothetical protein